MRGRHASCYEMSYSKRENKRKKFSPLCPLSSKLGQRQTSTLQGLHIAVPTHNCRVSSRSGVHFRNYTPCIPPHKHPLFTYNLHHSPCLPDILTPFTKHSFKVLIHLFLGLPIQRLPAHSYIDFLSPSSPHGRTAGEHFHQSFCVPPSSLLTTPLSVHSGLYPSS